MKITSEPAAPPARLAGVLLGQATEQDIAELRLFPDGDALAIHFDGQPQQTVSAGLFPSVSRAIFTFAGVRLWPWTRSLSGRRLDLEFETSGKRSSWVLESHNIKRELILSRAKD